MKMIMATGNKNKIKEVREILTGTGIDVISMKDAGIDIEIEETGNNFEENARLKAETIRDLTGQMVMADDSGLVIDAMPDELGVRSARFMGEDTSYIIKNKAILERMKDIPDEKRGARFVCTIAIAYPDKETEIYKGVFEGMIAKEIKGDNGFGYDPVFFVPEYGITSAEMSPEQKNLISHRAKALALVAEKFGI